MGTSVTPQQTSSLAVTVTTVPTPPMDPEQFISKGLWHVEPFYYSYGGGGGTTGGGNSNRPLKRGKAYKRLDNGDYVCFAAHDGTVYRVGDTVYLDSQQTDLPFFICGIQGFKMKKNHLNIKVNWYYRHTEVPEYVYHTLVQDRHTEHSQKQTESEHFIKDPDVKKRELFVSDAQDSYPISVLRGKCIVRHYKHLTDLKDFKPGEDTFFYILSYNPENNRLASIQGEIRVGPSHQAKLPECRRRQTSNGWSPSDDETADAAAPSETPVWIPSRLPDSEILMFLRTARGMAAFAGICDGTTEDGCLAATKDDTTINAYKALHNNSYDQGHALQDLLKRRSHPCVLSRWSEDETKKFVKGLKQWGKNFFRIRKELLTHKTTGELVEFYYLWKKSAVGSSQRPRQRQRRAQPTILRRIRAVNGRGLSSGAAGDKPLRPESSEFLDFSSASENEEATVDGSDSDSRDLTGYACHHCYSTRSKNWHHAGKDRALLCTDCRMYFKKYGELRPVDRPTTPPPYLFKPVQDEAATADFCDDFGVRTRAGKAIAKEIAAKRRTITPTAEMEASRKSPSTASTSSISSGNGGIAISSTVGDRDPLLSATKSGKKGVGGTGRKRKKTKGLNKVKDEDATNSNKKRRRRTSTEATKTAPEDSDADEEENDGDTSSSPQPTPPPTTNNATDNDEDTFTEKMELTKASVYDFKTDDDDSTVLSQLKPKPAEDGDQEGSLTPKPTAGVIQVNTNLVKTEEKENMSPNISATCTGDQPSAVCGPNSLFPSPGSTAVIDTKDIKQEPKADDLITYGLTTQFKKHWNPGEGNSCARTDLVFTAKPGTKFYNALERRRQNATSSFTTPSKGAAHNKSQAVKKEIKRETPPFKAGSTAPVVSQIGMTPSLPTGASTSGLPSPHLTAATIAQQQAVLQQQHVHQLHQQANMLAAAHHGAQIPMQMGAPPPNMTAVEQLRKYAEQQQQSAPLDPTTAMLFNHQQMFQHRGGLTPGGGQLPSPLHDSAMAERQRLFEATIKEKQREELKLKKDHNSPARTSTHTTPVPCSSTMPPPLPTPSASTGPPPSRSVGPPAVSSSSSIVPTQNGVFATPPGLPPPGGTGGLPFGVDPRHIQEQLEQRIAAVAQAARLYGGGDPTMMLHSLVSNPEHLEMMQQMASSSPIARDLVEQIRQLQQLALLQQQLQQHHTHSHTHTHSHFHIHPSAANGGRAGTPASTAPGGNAVVPPPPPMPTAQQPQHMMQNNEAAMIQQYVATLGRLPPGMGPPPPGMALNAGGPRNDHPLQQPPQLMEAMRMAAAANQFELQLRQQQEQQLQRQLAERHFNQHQQQRAALAAAMQYESIMRAGSGFAPPPGLFPPPPPRFKHEPPSSNR